MNLRLFSVFVLRFPLEAASGQCKLWYAGDSTFFAALFELCEKVSENDPGSLNINIRNSEQFNSYEQRKVYYLKAIFKRENGFRTIVFQDSDQRSETQASQHSHYWIEQLGKIDHCELFQEQRWSQNDYSSNDWIQYWTFRKWVIRNPLDLLPIIPT